MQWRSITTTIIETYKVLVCLSCPHGLSLTELSPYTVCVMCTVYIKRLTNSGVRVVSLFHSLAPPPLSIIHTHIHPLPSTLTHTNSLGSVSCVQPNSCVKVLLCNNKQCNIRVYTHTHTHRIWFAFDAT